MAAFDATAGEWIPSFSPNLNGAVYSLVASPDGRRLFVGGDFTRVDGQWTGALVSLDPATGRRDSSWQGRVGGYQVVRAFDMDSGWLYVGGGFKSVGDSTGGSAADRIARFRLDNGEFDRGWLPP